MAKIGQRKIKIPEGHGNPPLADLHYISEKSGYFFLSLPDEYREPSAVGLKTYYNRGKTLLGFEGETESVAIDAAEKYMQWYFENNSKKVHVILITTHDSRDKRTSWGFDDRCEVDIKFEFIVGYYVEKKDKRVYYYNPDYHKKEQGHSGNVGEGIVARATIIPFNQDMAHRCEAIVQQFHEINDKVRALFADTDAATLTLGSGNTLKLIGS